MKMMALLLLVLGISQGIEAKEISRADLLKGSPIPEKRDFKLGQEALACQDFHQYVCEAEEKAFKLPANRAAWKFAFTDNYERLLYAKKQFFKKMSQGLKPKTERAQQLVDFYGACMNEKGSRKFQAANIKKEVEFAKSLKTPEEWRKHLGGNIFKPDVSLLGFWSDANLDQPETLDGMIQAEILSFPEKRYYNNPEIVKAYTELLTEFFKTLKVDRAHERAKEVMDFQMAVAKVTPESNMLRERYNEKREKTLEQWQKAYPNFELATAFSQVPPTLKVRDIMPEANELINKELGQKPLEWFQSYYLSKALMSRLDDAEPKYFAKLFAFNHKFLGGPEKRPDRQERCTTSAMNKFGFELDNELIEVLFPGFEKAKVVNIAEGIRKQLVTDIQQNKWLSVQAKKVAQEKMGKAKLFLVKPEGEANWDFVPMRSYDKLNALKNEKTYETAVIEKTLQELKEKRNRDRWAMGPLAINAYYMPSDNTFVLLQGILQKPFYSTDYEAAENIAAIGTIVGHELGHGIDDEGSKFDASGKLNGWMTEKDLSEFKGRTGKLVEQFNKLGHDGKLTLGENIGDLVGISTSLRMAFPDLEKASVESLKKYFVGYARVWCGVTTPSFRERALKTDPHAQIEARINGQVVQQDAFYKAFQCKEGDKMYLPPSERVRVWN